jgi:stearoyl-CoA desaturase (delta-9 desaturase)
MLAIATFLVVHWSLTIFCQTFFLHRYSSHRMFEMSKGWERFFFLLTAVSQGSSFLKPRPYALLHRAHHAYSDTAKDPHSPHFTSGLGPMMWQTKLQYENLSQRRVEPEQRFEGGYPEWPAVEAVFDAWFTRIAFGVGYTLFYIAFAPHWAYFLLLPIHYIIGPIHGAIVNYCGHKFGYRNFATGHGDRSKNTLIVDFVTWGELFQNNHHARSMSPNFAAKWFEFDPTWPIIRVLAWLKVIKLVAPARAQLRSFPAADVAATPAA